MDVGSFGDLSDDEVIKAEISKIHEVLGRANPPVNWDNEDDETDVFASESSDNYESDSDFAPNSNLGPGPCAIIPRPDESSHSSFSDARAPSSLDEEVLIFDNNLPASDENCLHLNRLYQELLIENINQLQQLLAANKEKQTELQDSLDAKLRHGKSRTTYLTAANVFAIPYFKDVNGYHSPLNADALAKSLSKERDPSILPPRPWLPVDDKIFMDAIGLNAMQMAMQPTMIKKEELQMKLDLEVKADEKAGLALRMQEMDEQLAKIMEVPASELIELHQEKDFDWLMISTGTFHGVRSATDCELYWNNCLHPSINRSEWTKAETDKMKALAKKNKERDWDKIAENLQTMRRGWQCFIKYQSDLGFLKRKFSPEDDERLLNLVRNFATGSYIPWQQVCYHMDYFSKRQIRKRWTYYLDPRIRHGKWSLDEDLDLVKAVWKYGAANWRRFCLPGRTSKQCRARWLECLNPALSLEPFSADEDNLLESLVQQYPNAWTKIARNFKGRSCSMVKTRWNRIEGWRRRQLEKGIPIASTMFPPSRERTNKRHQHRGLVYRKLAAKLRVAGGPKPSSINTRMWIHEMEESEQPKNDEQASKDAARAARESKRVRPRTKNNRRHECVSDRRLNEMFWVCQGMGRYRNNFELDPAESATDELHIAVTQEIKKVMCVPCGSQERVTNFLAPNMSTLTAFRNLLLIRGRLRNLAKNVVCGKNRSHDDRIENSCKRFKACNNEIEPEDPDYSSREYQNLLANFCALFFWPAVFSGAAPKDEHLALKPIQTSRHKPRPREKKRACKKPWVTQRLKGVRRGGNPSQQDEVSETNHTQQDDSQRPLPDQGGPSNPITENVERPDGPKEDSPGNVNPPDGKRRKGRPLGSTKDRKQNVVTNVRRSSRTKK